MKRKKINKRNRKIKAIWVIFFLLVIIISIYFACFSSKTTTNIINEELNITNDVKKVSWNGGEEIEIKNNYKINVNIDTTKNMYEANLTINVFNDSQDEWDKIYFRDYPSFFKDIENGNISEISNIKNVKNNKSLEYFRDEKDNTVFYIKLDKNLKPGDFASIYMNYKAYIPNLDARFGYQIYNDDTHDCYLGNCFPILCPYEDGKFIYHPYFSVGECFYSRMANYEVEITVPKQYTIIATGDNVEQIENTNTITQKYIAEAVRDFCIVIGNKYEYLENIVDEIVIRSYFHNGNNKYGKEALDIGKNVIKQMNNQLGKYPYNQFSIIEAHMQMQGMEYPQMVLITDDEEFVGATYHEAIHEWFYLLIGNDSYKNPWIDESITTYLANPGLDQHTGIITKPYNEYNSDEDYTYYIYFCGASMYNKLEEKYGKKKINEFMEEYLDKYAYKEVTTQELVDLLIKYYGKDNKILSEYIEEKYLNNI